MKQNQKKETEIEIKITRHFKLKSHVFGYILYSFIPQCIHPNRYSLKQHNTAQHKQ